MYLHKDYTETIDYDFVKNTYIIKKYDREIDKSTSGFAEILNSKFLAWFFYQEKLYLATDKIQTIFQDIQLDLISDDTDNKILKQKLIIKKGSITIDTIEYTLNKEMIEEQINYTEMSELEDWNFGLQIINIFNDKNRQKTMLEVYQEEEE